MLLLRKEVHLNRFVDFILKYNSITNEGEQYDKGNNITMYDRCQQFLSENM